MVFLPLLYLIVLQSRRMPYAFWKSLIYPFSILELALVCAFFLPGKKWRDQPYIGGLAAIAFFPMLYLHVLEWWQFPFWGSPEFLYSVVELTLVCAFILLARKSRYQPYLGAMVLLVHYTLWTGQLLWTFYGIPLLLPKLFYIVFPGSGFAWLFYVKRLPSPEPAAPRSE